jgi:hypothetical protein
MRVTRAFLFCVCIALIAAIDCVAYADDAPVIWSTDPTVVDIELIEVIAKFAAAQQQPRIEPAESDAPPPPVPFDTSAVAMMPSAMIASPKSLQSYAINSRELVDVEFANDGALTILVSAPGAGAPGLYRWPANASAPKKICDIAAPSFFSFDRKVIIERIRGTPSRVRLYSPHDCARIADFEIAGRVLDIDVYGDRVAAAVRLSETQIALHLLSVQGAVLASAPIGRNVEMGFSPDGLMILNFDLSDSGARAWSVPKLADVNLPRWLSESEVTFVPGSKFVKRYAAGNLSIARWPAGSAVHAVTAGRNVRLRQLSTSGRVGIVHEYAQGADRLDWIDFANGLKTPLAAGSIDNAALSPDLNWAAWTLRRGTSSEVWVQRALAPALGTARLPVSAVVGTSKAPPQ